MEDRGEVISIKFSYDMKVLAIQRSHKSVVSATEGPYILQVLKPAIALNRYGSDLKWFFFVQEFVNFAEGLDVLEYSQSCKVNL